MRRQCDVVIQLKAHLRPATSCDSRQTPTRWVNRVIGQVLVATRHTGGDLFSSEYSAANASSSFVVNLYAAKLRAASFDQHGLQVCAISRAPMTSSNGNAMTIKPSSLRVTARLDR